MKKEIDNVIDIISAIRKYKSDNQMSMKKEIDKLFINGDGISASAKATADYSPSENKKIEKHFDLIASVMNVKTIELKKITSKIKIA